MKRILCLTLLICSLASSCFASVPFPYFPRWYPVWADNKMRLFIDEDTGRWEIDNEGLWGHKGHVIATVWVMCHYVTENTYCFDYGLWCIDCKSEERLRFASYDSDGKFQGSIWNNGPIEKEPAPPNSYNDAILDALKDIWERKK